MDMADEELAVLYMKGKAEAFDILLNRHKQRIYSYIIFIVHKEDVANDIFQDTFMKVIVRLQQGDYAPTGKFGGWILRIAHNAIMDWYRAMKSEKVVEQPDDNNLHNLTGEATIVASHEAGWVNKQVMNDVRRLVAALPAAQREVLFMRFFQQMSFKEISAATGVSINTALGRMRYALINLRRLVRTHGIELQMEA